MLCAAQPPIVNRDFMVDNPVTFVAFRIRCSFPTRQANNSECGKQRMLYLLSSLLLPIETLGLTARDIRYFPHSLFLLPQRD